MEQARGQMTIGDFLGMQPESKPRKANRATSSITLQTRRASHDATDKAALSNRVLAVLYEKELTAREIAQEMYRLGYIAYPERAVIQPRITELVQAGLVEATGKKRDEVTQRTVAAYKVV